MVIYVLKGPNDTRSSSKCHGNIPFYTSTRHRNTSKYQVNTTSMKWREVTSLNDVSYCNDVKVVNKIVVAKMLFFLQTSLKFAVAAFLEVRKIPIEVRENLQTSCR